MRHGGIVTITIALALGCAGATAEGPRPSPTAGTEPPDVPTANHVATADDVDDDEETDADAGTDTVHSTADEIVVSGHGFTPQPAIRSGTAGSTDPTAARDGQSLDPSCIGTFPSAPQHIIKLGGRIDVLRVLVDSDGNDLTLAIRTPDGAWHCNDDSGDPLFSLNPTVELYSPPAGEIEVWVGTYSPYYSGAQYQLGVTEQQGVYPSDVLRH